MKRSCSNGDRENKRPVSFDIGTSAPYPEQPSTIPEYFSVIPELYPIMPPPILGLYSSTLTQDLNSADFTTSPPSPHPKVLKPASKGLIRDKGFHLKDLPEHTYHLGANAFSTVNIFKDMVKVHLRIYTKEYDGFHPSVEGVTMTGDTWQWFSDFLLNDFNPLAKDATSIVGKQLFIIVNEHDDCTITVQFQQLFRKNNDVCQLRPVALNLNPNQMDKLRTLLPDITRSVCSLLYKKVLVSEIQLAKTQYLSIALMKSTTEVFDHLYTIITRYLREGIESILICHGCERMAGGQLSHECITLTSEDRLALYGTRAFCALPMKNIAEAFCAQYSQDLYYLTSDFFETLDFTTIREIVYEKFKIPEY